MLSSSVLAILGLVSAAAAAPAPQPLAIDDVIVLKTDGTSQVMKAAEFDALNKAAPAPAKPEGLNVTDAPALRRRCDESTEVQVLSDEEFLNWDIAISPVVSSLGGDATVAVSAGYSISNSLNVGASASVSFLEGVLGLSLSVSYTESWTTTQDLSQSFGVPEGMHGVIVSQPYVRRVQGYVYDGCTDDWQKTAFTSDTYTSLSYGNLQWVKGLIRLCSSETYPIPYCIGEGVHA